MSHPGQSKYRLNPKPSYTDKMTETRSTIRRIMLQALRDITHDEVATMHYATYWRDIVVRYRVMIDGWPQDIPFKNLSNISNNGILDRLLQGWQSGGIHFRRISDAEFASLCANATTGGETEGAEVSDGE
ncbi:uncharacterized protein FIBRA_04769 [Fibroporia radiculosa]|uniref:Uncharacterized protein n=1 Tax=Fibroporia radiculosa TaxID=599839 RepID=J4GPS8_9APHY|nr:uncharacterized protein FIBRA_04769 [Fibroporia radiculosa]CCM02665.1 predicted protein [Fibroporia radiculosa]